MEPDSPCAPGAQRYQKSTPTPPHTVTAATDGSAPSVFGSTPDYSTERVGMFWQPPSSFSQG